MSSRRSLLALVVALLSVAVFAQAPQYSSTLWGGMRYRLIGPFRGGRVTAVTGVPSQPNVYYFGSTGGGVWKTTDAGVTWNNVSDAYFAVGSMGALAVADSDPNVVYAGTGSSKIRSNVSIGRGIYKSTNAGRSWQFIGLRDVGQIATVVVSPSDANLVYVAAVGDPFADNVDRGVYRSKDGGATWEKVFYVSPSLGAAAIAMDPSNPNTLYAAMWHGLRKPWTIISGSPASEGAGIYKTTDGGDHWNKLGNGLPDQLFGRANIGISKSNPQRVYALVEALPGGGLYRSEDAGATWKEVNDASGIITRPFYYDTLGVDPNNADVVYVGDENWFKSTDGGVTFTTERTPHGDNHDVWINPNNSLDMIQSNDGGANVSLDGGKTWSTQANQPTAEIYNVAFDNQYPYEVYGAQQDDDTVIMPSLAPADGQDFRTGPGCETGPIMPSQLDAKVVYGACKGQFSRENITTGNEQPYWIGAESLYGNGGGTLIDRFQRVSPMETSPHDPHVVYYGSQYLYRSSDGGVTWQKMSPDLTADPPGEPQESSGFPITRDDTGEEVYSTLYTVRESPVQAGLIWTGSNDGLVYVTRDDGKTWTNVTPKGLPPEGRVNNIEPSPHDPARAYVAIYRYYLGDFSPYLYRTDDYGKTWTKLTDGHNGIASDEPTRVVREDPVKPHLLYAGTEFGIYISFDDGAQWQPFQLNLPHTVVTDIKLGHGDLILSTQGRSDWILDNLSPLRQLSPAVATAEYTLFAPRDAVRSAGRGGGGFGRGAGPQYPAHAATIDYYLKAEPAQDLKLEILNGSGQIIQTISSAAPAGGGGRGGRGGGGGRGGRGGANRLDKTAGMHRFEWDLRDPGPTSANGAAGGNGPVAVPGKYQVRLSTGQWTQTQPLTIVEDPRITADGVTTADLQEQFDHNMRVRDLVSDLNKLVARVRAAERNLPSGVDKAKLDALDKALITSTVRYSQPALDTQITYLYSMNNNADQKIGRDGIARYGVLKAALAKLQADADALLGAGN